MTTKTKEEWKNLVHEGKAWAYIKPNRYKHDSGWRCFEVGFMTIGNTRVKDKLVLSLTSDHIYLSYIQTLIKKQPFPLNLDLTLDGYIRLWNHGGIVEWSGYDCEFSSAELQFIPSTPSKEEKK